MPQVIKDAGHLFDQRRELASNVRAMRSLPVPSDEGPSVEALAGLLEIVEQMPPGATLTASSIAALLACAMGEI